MGLLDWITRAQEKGVARAQEKLNNLQKRIDTFPLEELYTKKEKEHEAAAPKQSKIAKQTIKRFYADYPVIPYVSNDRSKDWLERATLFPKQSIIPKSMMTRYADGLLPGHIYMLYWLKKYTNKKVPSYFEYKYGIDFEKEKHYLCECGYLDDRNKPTGKGEEAINSHAEVIEQHSAASTIPAEPENTIESISKQIIAQRDSFIRNGFKEYSFIASRYCYCSECSKLDGKHFPLKELEIGINAPPMHEGCRCSISAYTDRKEYEEWLNYLSKGGTTKGYEKKKRKR